MSNESHSQPPSANAPKLPPWLILVIILGIMGFSWWQNQHSVPTESVTASSDSPLLLKDLSPKNSQVLSDPLAVPDEDEPTLPSVTPEADVRNSDVSQDPSGKRKASAGDPVSTTKTDRSNTPRAAPSGRSGEPNGKTSARMDPAPPAPRPPNSGPLSDIRTKPTTPSQSRTPKAAESDRVQATADETAYLVPNQSIRDLNGRVVYKGTVDLEPTLDRIERGEANRHRNDGAQFQNRENRLPRKPSGYYKEYVHPTPGENGPGPQRIIIGKQGEVWYSADHYKTFKKIK